MSLIYGILDGFVSSTSPLIFSRVNSFNVSFCGTSFWDADVMTVLFSASWEWASCSHFELGLFV